MKKMFAYALLALVTGLAVVDCQRLRQDAFRSLTSDIDTSYSKIFNSGNLVGCAQYYAKNAFLSFGPLNGMLITAQGRDDIYEFLQAERKRGVKYIDIIHNTGELQEKKEGETIWSEADLVLYDIFGRIMNHGHQSQLLRKVGNRFEIVQEMTRIQ